MSASSASTECSPASRANEEDGGSGYLLWKIGAGSTDEVPHIQLAAAKRSRGIEQYAMVSASCLRRYVPGIMVGVHAVGAVYLEHHQTSILPPSRPSIEA